MNSLDLIPPDALRGVRLGVSVSDSADLPSLGLSLKHAELAIGEIARAVLVGGGQLVYGGRVKPSGFTQYLMNEVRRYGGPRSLTLCLAAPEHRRLSRDELDTLDRELGTKGTVVCLDESGQVIERILNTKPADADPITDEAVERSSYSGLRAYMSGVFDARVLLGGQLDGFKGVMPGIVEEAMTSVKRRQPLFVSSGFGGASAAVARGLGLDDLSWAPPHFPSSSDPDRLASEIAQLSDVANSAGWRPESCGLDESERLQLSASHRPGEIASLVARGMAHLGPRTTQVE